MKGLGDKNPNCDYKQLCGDTWTLEMIQRHLGHQKIDLLKLDIEGWEWPIFDIAFTNASMPMELLMEVHYSWHGRGTRGVVHNQTMSSAKDLVRLQSHLLRLGYAVAHRDDNPSCRHCTELTLVSFADLILFVWMQGSPTESSQGSRDAKSPRRSGDESTYTTVAGAWRPP